MASDLAAVVALVDDPVVLDETVDDHVLVRGVLAGDPRAYELLVRRHQGRIYRLALRMLDDPLDAEDASQDVLARLPSALRSFEGTSALPTWLHRVVANHCLKQIHRRRRTRVVDHDDDGVPTTSPGCDAVVVSRQRSVAVAGAVAALTPSLRDAITLCELDGLSYSQAAAALCVPESTVRGRLARARRALQPSLAAWR